MSTIPGQVITDDEIQKYSAQLTAKKFVLDRIKRLKEFQKARYSDSSTNYKIIIEDLEGEHPIEVLHGLPDDKKRIIYNVLDEYVDEQIKDLYEQFKAYKIL